MAKYYFSPRKQKALLLLLAGVALSLTKSSYRQWRILKGIPKEWRAIDRAVLYRILREFYQERLVDFREEKDGTSIVTLTEKGRHYALRYKIDELIPAKDIVDFIIEVFEIRPHVQYLEVTSMTNDAKLKLHFGLK